MNFYYLRCKFLFVNNMTRGIIIVFRRFTLLELLLTIGLIALLAALLLPALSRSRDESRAALCRNNLRQIALANLSYVADFDHYSPYSSGAAMIPGLKTWAGLRGSAGITINSGGYLDDYLARSRSIMICPSWLMPNSDEVDGAGYGYNWKGVGSMSYLGCDDYGNGMKASRMEKFTDTVMFSDAANGGGMAPVTEPQPTIVIFPRHYPKTTGGVMTSSPGFGFTHPRHHRQSSVSWADGHVDMNRTTQVATYAAASRNNIGWLGPDDDAWYEPILEP